MMLESEIEAAVGTRLLRWGQEELGSTILYLKLNLKGRRGLPDRLILWKPRGVMFIEFKRPGGEPRKLQVYVHRILEELGFTVEVHDNVDRALESIKAKIRTSTCADARPEAHDGTGRG